MKADNKGSRGAPGSPWVTGRCSLEIVENGKLSKSGLVVRGGVCK
jgi:hypothetical protein